ncbi:MULTISPECIES: hypothetical protein [Aurantimonas]|uniref:hypothetical protein n=1 Tax=Aurantimonas TaxID=182269 RepID=UPI003514EFF0
MLYKGCRVADDALNRPGKAGASDERTPAPQSGLFRGSHPTRNATGATPVVCPLSKRLSGASIITTAYSEQGKELRYLYKDFGFWVSPD